MSCEHLNSSLTYGALVCEDCGDVMPLCRECGKVTIVVQLCKLHTMEMCPACIQESHAGCPVSSPVQTKADWELTAADMNFGRFTFREAGEQVLRTLPALIEANLCHVSFD